MAQCQHNGVRVSPRGLSKPEDIYCTSCGDHFPHPQAWSNARAMVLHDQEINSRNARQEGQDRQAVSQEREKLQGTRQDAHNQELETPPA